MTPKEIYFVLSITLAVFLGTVNPTRVFCQDIESFLRPYADEITRSSALEFVDRDSGKKYAELEGLPLMDNLALESHYYRWHYTSALVHDGLLLLGNALEDEAYAVFGREYYGFVFDNQEYLESLRKEGMDIEGLDRFGRFRGLWDNGAQAAALAKVYEQDPRPEYREYLGQTAEFFFEYDRDTRNLSRRRNVDQVYTQGVFMARMGKLTGDNKYLDYCVEKVIQNDSIFLDPGTGLYDQMYYPELRETNRIKWLRGMGWSLLAYVNILEYLPEDHPGYQEVLSIYRKRVACVSAYQNASGLWKHLVDHPDSYEETSGSVYLVYSIARGVNKGFLDPMYRDVAMAGWKGLESRRRENGDIIGSTPGVNHSTSPAYYLNFPTTANGDHLFGILFMAGAEMITLHENFKGPVPRNWDINND